MSLERKFSNVYVQIVRHEMDIEGRVAYTLYKAAKIKYIKQYQAECKRSPTETDLETFHKMALAIIPTFRSQAKGLLYTFSQLNLENMKREVEKDLKAMQEENLKAIIRPLIPPPPKGPWDGFWMSVLIKSVQAAIVGLLLFFIIFGATAKDGFWEAIRKLFPPAQETRTTAVVSQLSERNLTAKQTATAAESPERDSAA